MVYISTLYVAVARSAPILFVVADLFTGFAVVFRPVAYWSTRKPWVMAFGNIASKARYLIGHWVSRVFVGSVALLLFGIFIKKIFKAEKNLTVIISVKFVID